MRDLIPAESLVHPNHRLSLTIESADHAAWCKQTLRTIYAYAEEVETAIAAWVGETEHPLEGGGEVIKKTYRNVTRTSLPELTALARTLGATDEQIAACTHLSKESGGIRIVKQKERAA